ncbi:MAG TPA: exodeoxyribonuclease V subunit gamma, partial [Spirochaetota bacterium]|nr:exodeoxyribonuclease V subunit gamma [Spirochaetota bacterium]
MADSFFKSLESEKDLDNPFHAPLIIVPNVNLVKYLKMYIARRQNICLNIDFKFLENGITLVLNNLDKKSKDTNKKNIFLGDKINHLELQLMILSSLMENDDLTNINKFTGSDKYSKSYIKKIWQLSNKLASLFREYDYQRREMVIKWLNESVVFNQNQMEKEQSLIYKNIYKDNGIIKMLNSSQNDYFYTNLPDYTDNLFNNLDNEEFTDKEYIYFFGFSQISQFHYDIIFKLSKFYEIRFYKLNFLYEFSNNMPDEKRWENIAKLKIENNRVIPDEKENNLVKIWANPSRESIKLLGSLINEKKNIDIKSFWLKNNLIKIENPTVLNTLQNQIVNNSLFETSNEKIKQDNSIQIINCPDIFREIETVYNSIIYNMESDKTLNLTDIAILVPNMKKYVGVIKSIFQRERSIIPFNLTDINAKDESLFGKALIKLLEITLGSFSRGNIFELFSNEIFLVSNGLSIPEVTKYLNWIENLNIFRNYDAGNNDLYTWWQGFTRLKLGSIMEYNEDENFTNYKNIVPYSDIDTMDKKKLNKFITICEN